MGQIFPQADDLNKIIAIIGTKEENLDTEKLKVDLYLGTSRQIGYYLSACRFLNILDNKNKFTIFGKKLKLVSKDSMFDLLSKKIISKEVFGECFFKSLKDKKIPNRDFVAQYILTLTEIKNYSVAFRRSQTVISWIRKILHAYDIDID